MMKLPLLLFFTTIMSLQLLAQDWTTYEQYGIYKADGFVFGNNRNSGTDINAMSVDTGPNLFSYWTQHNVNLVCCNTPYAGIGRLDAVDGWESDQYGLPGSHLPLKLSEIEELKSSWTFQIPQRNTTDKFRVYFEFFISNSTQGYRNSGNITVTIYDGEFQRYHNAAEPWGERVDANGYALDVVWRENPYTQGDFTDTSFPLDVYVQDADGFITVDQIDLKRVLDWAIETYPSSYNTEHYLTELNLAFEVMTLTGTLKTTYASFYLKKYGSEAYVTPQWTASEWDGASGNDDIVSVSAPASVTPGTNATVTVEYEAAGNRDIHVVFQKDTPDWDNYGSAKVDVSAGSGTVNVTVPINANTPIANDAYQFQTFMTSDGGGWPGSDNLARTNIDAVSGSTEGQVTVRARMTNGSSDQLQLRVNNNTVKTWTINSSSYTNYTHTLTSGGNVKLYFPDNGTDMEVDWLRVDGTTYQAENQSSNTSVWQNGSCGGSNSQFLHCAGAIDFGTINVGASTITVRGRGQCGSETIVLEVGGTNVRTWNNISTSNSNYTYDNYTGGNVKVKFTNDGNNGCDKNVFIDYVKVDNTTYQTENTATRTGCGNNQWLWCNGNFDFGNLGTSSRNFVTDDVFLSSAADYNLFPNPIAVNGELTLSFLGDESFISIMALSGQILSNQKIKPGQGNVDISGIAPGIYFLKVSGQKQPLRFIIQ